MPLPKPPAEVPRVTSLDDCAPGFVRKLNQLLYLMGEDGHPAVIGETLRTPERQEYLHGFGREYDDGRGDVTGAVSAATSWHGYGLSADIWDGSLANPWAFGQAFRDALGINAVACGLAWGGDWPERKDYPHVQWAPMKRSPSIDAQSLYAQGAIADVWKIVGADA